MKSMRKLDLIRGLLVGAMGALALGHPARITAQSPAIAEAPVIYDRDRLSPEFHKSRRDSVLAGLPSHAVALVFSAPSRNRENDVDYEYRQSSDLYYLTGTHEQNSVLLLSPGGIDVGGQTVTELLLAPQRNPATEMWTGRLFGPERAAVELGIEKVLGLERYDDIMTSLLADETHRLYHLPLPTGVDENSPLNRQLALVRAHGRLLEVEGSPMVRTMASRIFRTKTEDMLRQNQMLLERVGRDVFDGSALAEIVDRFAGSTTVDEWLAWKREHLDAKYADGISLRARLDELRAVKADEELALLRRAIDITTAAHREAMKSIVPGMYEYEVEALVEYVFRRNGAEAPGFPSIIGSGENSVILHYESNRRQMQEGDVVVMDIGAEYHGYSADVTRTVPVSGRFTPQQRRIYDIVLAAQEAGIAAARTGLLFGGVHDAAFRVVSDGLQSLGLVDDDRGARRFFMHGTSHYVGLYVHDVGTWGPLLPGTVITVEPGIYISPAPDVDPRWWNIGVRIEDDVLVTAGDPVVLSAGAPRAAAAIEELMRQDGLGNEAAGVVWRPAARGNGR
jgi:Xaa-Pro aminopeptidase